MGINEDWNAINLRRVPTPWESEQLVILPFLLDMPVL
jgi:hypothetical protein